MKKIILLLVIIGLFFVGYQNKTVLAEQANHILYQSPCDTPKTFRVGTIDTRFNISKSELIQDAEEAGNVWKNDNGTVLLQYDPNSKMPINMVYDQRQYLNSQINNLDNQVSEQKKTLNPQIADYQEQVAEFKKKSDDLNAKIQYWNSKGGAPKDEYDKLVSEQQALQQQAARLQEMADKLNQSTDQYNQQIQQLNQRVDTYNNVLQYKPEEGEYSQVGPEEKIDIFFNNSHQELVHTLSHEMGHALGLDHNNNPESIMFPKTNLIITPSADDISALAQVCQKRSIFTLAGERIFIAVSTLKQELSSNFAH